LKSFFSTVFEDNKKPMVAFEIVQTMIFECL